MKDLIISKQDEIIQYLFIEYGDRFMDDQRFKKLQSELSSLKSAKEEVKSAEILSADEMLTNHFLDDNWEPNYQNIVKIMDKFHSQFQSVQSKEAIETVFTLPEISENDKKTTIDQFIRMTAKYTLQLFMMFGLKTHIEAKVVNEPTKEEFIFSFKKVQPVQSVKGEGERTDEIRHKLVAKSFEFEDSDGIKHSPWITLKDAIDILESYKHSESEDMYPKEFIEFLCDYYQKFWNRYILLMENT